MLVTLLDCKHAERAAMSGVLGTSLLGSMHAESREQVCRGAGEQRASMPAALADSSPHDTSVIQNAGEFRECGC